MTWDLEGGMVCDGCHILNDKKMERLDGCLEYFTKWVSTRHKGVSQPMAVKSQVLGTSKTRNFGAPAFGTRLGGSLAPKRVSKSMGFKMASSGIFKTRNCGAPAILVRDLVFPRGDALGPLS